LRVSIGASPLAARQPKQIMNRHYPFDMCSATI
jgi:hypothetical protein